MKKIKLVILTMVALGTGVPVSEAGYSLLNSASDFAVLGASTVTSTGNTVVNGNLGVFPGSAITGFGPGIVNGITYLGGAVAQQAAIDALNAYTVLGSEGIFQSLSGQNLGGLMLGPGVRNFSSSAQLTGVLVLDAQGDANARFDFQVGSTLTTASGSSVQLINGAQANNVNWQIGSSATIGSDTAFIGSILADQSITLNSGASLIGRALALHGAVTMDNNYIIETASVPEPGNLLASSLAVTALLVWKGVAKWRRKTKGV
ncbi:MAG: ice-binding family protein [Verrucomicrobiota bacterium]